MQLISSSRCVHSGHVSAADGANHADRAAALTPNLVETRGRGCEEDAGNQSSCSELHRQLDVDSFMSALFAFSRDTAGLFLRHTINSYIKLGGRVRSFDVALVYALKSQLGVSTVQGFF